MGSSRFLFYAVIGFFLASACHDRQLSQTIYPIPTDAEKSDAYPPPPALASITVLKSPESVLHDPQQDLYFISNMNGGLTATDNNGFISRVQPETMRVELKWIEGGKNGARLDAPKGMAIVGDTLYVSDVTAVRKFDRRTGRPMGEVKLPAATLINDLTTDGKSVFVSDTGVKPAAGVTFLSTGSDAIWKISGDHATKIAEGRSLRQPNGLDFHDGALWVSTFEGNEIYRLDGTERVDIVKVPRGELDGLVHLADGSRLVSSWLGSAIYRGDRYGEFTPVLKGIASPADIGYDHKRNRLLVPNTPANAVTIHAMPAAAKR